MDGLFINICNHIAAQFRIIAFEIEKLTAVIRGKQFSTMHRLNRTRNSKNLGSLFSILAKSSQNLMFNEQKNQELRQKLIKLIGRQVIVMDITDQLVDAYAIMIFAHFFSAAIIICFASFNILMVRRYSIAECVQN